MTNSSLRCQSRKCEVRKECLRWIKRKDILAHNVRPSCMTGGQCREFLPKEYGT